MGLSKNPPQLVGLWHWFHHIQCKDDRMTVEPQAPEPLSRRGCAGGGPDGEGHLALE